MLNGLVLDAADKTQTPTQHLTSFLSEMMRFGYVADEKLTNAMEQLSEDQITSLYLKVIPILKESVGAHRVHKPFYPNFPKQVMEMDEAELYMNALAHYWTKGSWQPDFTINDRPVSFEKVNFKTLTLVSEADLDNVFTQIVASADSISGFSKEVVEWFIDSGRDLTLPENIPFKENVCLVAGAFLQKDKWDSKLIKDTTDVLRVATYLSGGDISLASNTKFKSLPRKTRRLLTRELERVAREEDFVKHKEKWIKLFHNLHVGEYSKKLFALAKKFRENEKVRTFEGKVELAFANSNVEEAIFLLKKRPGIFARRIIDLIYKDVRDHSGIVDAFAEVVDKVPTRNLTQLWGAVKVRDNVLNKRVVFPKGMVQSAYVLRNEVARLVPAVREKLLDVIKGSLAKRFKDLDSLGNVYIDPNLYECPLPTGMRSASEGLKEVARGTRMPIGDKANLRFFIYWKGQDIDLSASLHDENFEKIEDISYYNLKGNFGCHSGDITSAPSGASEFIDINIKRALAKGRYIAMHVMVYTGPTFAEHEECFAGWMTRDKVNSNEIYEPKTVEQKIDLRSGTKNVIPVLFDLKERKAIWADISTNGKRFNTDSSNWGRSGNNVENNRATIQDMVEAFVSLDNKITLGELFEIHAQSRGNIVTERKDADTVFAMDEGVTPYDITDINADYVIG